ncbi:MAG TPA: glycosyltransferase family 2 protein [Bellilinea sp.]|jgi:glycosyltransferase involved in cell wall biosynthesis|nr:glycosyltransferase family 2 protein [Bellilinea sp.]
MELSIVIPVYNEYENLPLLYEALIDSLKEVQQSWEAILVNDGSKDGSSDVLKNLAEKDPEHIRVIELRRNFGQTAAIAAGIDHALGDIVILMDADLQNDPHDIPMMLEKINEGYDVVSGWRRKRQDTYISRTLPSHLANALISKVTGVYLHDYGCTLKAYRREVITGFRLYGEMHRFIPVYADSVGAKILEVEVNHHPRKFGKAKYGLERTFKVLLDLVTVKFLSSYSNKPIYLFGGMGVGLIGLGLLLFLFLLIRKIGWAIGVTTSPFFQTATMLIILGFQSVLMGLIAELQVRTYHESQNKPTYTIRTMYNISHDPFLPNGNNHITQK